MTRKQVINAPRLLEAAEYLIFILDVRGLGKDSLYLENAIEQLRKAAEDSREPLHINQGEEIEFPD